MLTTNPRQVIARIALLSIIAMAAHVYASEIDELRFKPVAGDPVVDAATFIKDQDLRDAALAAIAADRFSFVADLQNATALSTDVKKFFADRATAQSLADTIHTDRHQFRFDIKPGTGGISRPPRGASDLNAAVTQFFKDFDARVAGEAAVASDYAALKISVLAQDKAGVTSNGNQFFHDRFATAQARLNEAYDVFNIKKVIKFKGQKIALVKPSKGNDLMGHTSMFLTDRAAWLADAVAIAAARNNMRSALGTASLQASVTTWLNARRTHRVAGIQLSLDRFAMKVDVGLAKQKDPKTKAIAMTKTGGAEDSQDAPDNNLDESSEDNGEK